MLAFPLYHADPLSHDFAPNDRPLENPLPAASPLDHPMGLPARSKTPVVSSVELPATPPGTPSTAESLNAALASISSTRPFADLSCLYCCPSKACPGGHDAACFKMFTTLGPVPAAAGAFVAFQRAEAVECAKIMQCYREYVRKIDQHHPYSERGMAHEREKAGLAVQQLEVCVGRLEELSAAAEMMSEAEAVGDVLASEAEVVRGWVWHLWGKMVKNHECLKLNFSLTFLGTY